mgnify:CR=1 FL=1
MDTEERSRQLQGSDHVIQRAQLHQRPPRRTSPSRSPVRGGKAKEEAQADDPQEHKSHSKTLQHGVVELPSFSCFISHPFLIPLFSSSSFVSSCDVAVYLCMCVLTCWQRSESKCECAEHLQFSPSCLHKTSLCIHYMRDCMLDREGVCVCVLFVFPIIMVIFACVHLSWAVSVIVLNICTYIHIGRSPC